MKDHKLDRLCLQFVRNGNLSSHTQPIESEIVGVGCGPSVFVQAFRVILTHVTI